MKYLHAFVVPLTLSVCAAGCKSSDDTSTKNYYLVDAIGLKLPEIPGWQKDRSVQLENPDAGGVVYRLVRSGVSVPGSPRIDVILEPKQDKPTHIESFLTRNLREMAEMETNGVIRITHVDERPFNVGPRKGFRVRHEYVMGKGAQSVAVTQLSVFLVLDGRGVAITAAGQTELFNPQAAAIEDMLQHLAIVPPKKPEPKRLPKSLVEPVDLGKIGGQDKK